MPKNIVLCSDGTGQAGGQGFVSNVWRVFKSIERHDEKTEQIAFHTDGVGTETNRVLRAIGGGFGYGLSEDIRTLYSMLVRSYSESDSIYLFGFSRGAFTVRSLAGMIHHVGILKRDAYKSDKELTDAVKEAYIAYRKDKPLGVSNVSRPKIKFVGVWDTVDAVGVPFDGLRSVVYGLAKFRFTRHKDELNPSIENAFHAMSIDDERHTFHPRIWDESGFKGAVEQVWFAGVHTNVGGGYPKDSLAFIPLDWMMRKAHDCGLVFQETKWQHRITNDSLGDYQEQADRNGRIYDSRAGLAMYYRYRPRKIEKLWAQENSTGKPKIHESVLMRIKHDHTNYAPTAIPQNFETVYTWKPDIVQTSFTLDLSTSWEYIAKRIMLYRAFVTTTVVCLITAILMDGSAKENTQEISSLVTATTDPALNIAGRLINNLASNPFVLSGFVFAFAMIGFLHVRWKNATERCADEAWRSVSINMGKNFKPRSKRIVNLENSEQPLTSAQPLMSNAGELENTAKSA